MRAPTEFKRLEDVCELFADGDWIETEDQSPSGIRLIQTGNVGNGEFKDRGEKARFVSEATFKRLRCTEYLKATAWCRAYLIRWAVHAFCPQRASA